MALVLGDSGAILSLADFYYIALYKYVWVYLFIPLHSLFAVYLMRENMYFFKVTKYKSRKNLFYHCAVKTDLWICLQAAVVTCIIFMIGKILSENVINWNSETSLFFYEVGETADCSIIKVLVYFYVIYVIKTGIAVNFAMLLYWFSENSALAILFPMSIGVLETFYSKTAIFHNFFQPNYEVLAGEKGLGRYIFYLAFFSVIEMVTVKIFVERKDFLYEK